MSFPIESPPKKLLVMPRSAFHHNSADHKQDEQAPTFRNINDPNHFKRSKSDYFPPGVRFQPHDHELIIYYLQKKVNKEALPHDRIKAVNFYQHNPDYLTAQYPALGDKKWYFFTPRDRKYPNGERPNRAAGDGYWKATGADKPVDYKDQVVGLRKALVFYVGKPPHGKKTNWIMHEFRVEGPPRIKESKNDMKLDDWVLCRIYKKETSAKEKKGIVQDDMVTDKGEKGGVFCQVQHKPNPILNPAATFLVGSTSAVNDNDVARGSSKYDNYIEPPQHPIIPQSIDDYILQYPNLFAAPDPPPTLDSVAWPLAARAPPFHPDN